MRKHDIQVVAKGEIYRYFQNGEYKRYRKYNKKTGDLLFEDVMDLYTRTRKERLEYNQFGYLHRKLIYKSGTTNVLEEIYYDDKGKVYLTKSFKGLDVPKLTRIILYRDGKLIQFNNKFAFFTFAFNLIIGDNTTTICDARTLDQPLLECTAKTKKVFVLHSNHAPEGERRKTFAYLLDHWEKADKIVTLTQSQFEDLVQEGIPSNKMSVIPHGMDVMSAPTPTTRQRDREFVFIGRLAAEKQIPDMIQAFQQISERNPAWHFSIFGEGEERDNLQALINSLHLQERIHLKGFTADPAKVFQTAACSLITSKFEGFGLVIMESIYEGCPVIAYDFKYGPRDLIQVGENGILVAPNQVTDLAEAMQQMIDQPLKNVTLSEAFYAENSMEKWEALLAAL